MRVPAVHENVHQRTGEQEEEERQVVEKPREMRPVFGDQEIGGNDEKSDEYPLDPGFRSIAAARLVPMLMIHWSVLSA
jgi:hypothetical protein